MSGNVVGLLVSSTRCRDFCPVRVLSHPGHNCPSVDLHGQLDLFMLSTEINTWSFVILGFSGGSGRGRGLAASASSSFEAVLRDALRGQLGQNVVQVVGVRVAVTRQVGHHLRLVVDVVPHHRVGLAGGAGRPHGEDEAPHPGHLQQLQHLDREDGAMGEGCPPVRGGS